MSDETTITRQPKRMLADVRATTANSSRRHLLTRALLDAFHRGSGPPPVRTTTAALRTERSHARQPCALPGEWPGGVAPPGRAAPVPRTGTQPLAVPAAWGSPVRDRPQATTAPLAGSPCGATGSHVPCKSLSRARATSTPDAIWAV